MRSLAVVAVLLAARVAHANEADQAFEKGRALMDAQKYAEACAQFEISLKLDFQMGTLYNVASCDEKIGKLASALKAYRKLARDDVNPTRKATSTDLAAKLAPRVPRLVITVPTRPPGLHVQLDGDLVDDEIGVEIPVDLGTHAVTATAPGVPDQTKSIEVKTEGELVKSELIYGGATTAPTSHTPMSRATIGKITMASGGAVIAAGLVVGIFALEDWHSAQDQSATDVDAANSQVSHVQKLGDVSTVCVVVGALAVGAGIYLWRSGSGSTTVGPQIGADSAGAMMYGHF